MFKLCTTLPGPWMKSKIDRFFPCFKIKLYIGMKRGKKIKPKSFILKSILKTKSASADEGRQKQEGEKRNGQRISVSHTPGRPDSSARGQKKQPSLRVSPSCARYRSGETVTQQNGLRSVYSEPLLPQNNICTKLECILRWVCVYTETVFQRS